MNVVGHSLDRMC